MAFQEVNARLADHIPQADGAIAQFFQSEAITSIYSFFKLTAGVVKFVLALAERQSQYVSLHAAISVPLSLEEIERIAQREGWWVFPCSRDGLFDVIELWVENWLMLELLTPAMAAKYLDATSPASLARMMDQMAAVEARR